MVGKAEGDDTWPVAHQGLIQLCGLCTGLCLKFQKWINRQRHVHLHHNGNLDIPLPWKWGAAKKILIEEKVTLKECGLW